MAKRSKKKMKRMLALMLTTSMFLSSFEMAALADETNQQDGSSGGSVEMTASFDSSGTASVSLDEPSGSDVQDISEESGDAAEGDQGASEENGDAAEGGQEASEESGDAAEGDQGASEENGDAAEGGQGASEESGDAAEGDQGASEESGDAAEGDQGASEESGDAAEGDQEASEESGDAAADSQEPVVSEENVELKEEIVLPAEDGSDDLAVDIVEEGQVKENDQASSNTAGTVTEPTGEGDALKADNPQNYDQTTITTTDRVVTSAASGGQVTTGDLMFKDENGNPLYRDENGNALYVRVNEDGSTSYVDENGNPAELRNEDGFNYEWNNIHMLPDKGWSTGRVYFHSYNADGTPVYTDEAGNSVAFQNDGACIRVISCDNGTPDNPDDDYLITGLYCIDASTGIKEYFDYRRVNLEDAADPENGYFTEEEAAHLRAIMANGYQHKSGDNSRLEYTNDLPIINGVTGEGAATDNLAEMQVMLAEAQSAGNAVLQGFDFTTLTAAQAATATNMAIWHFGNRFSKVDESQGQYLQATANDGMIDAVYQYLISLTKEAEETQIIDEEKFIDDMQLVVGSMVKEDASNKDSNKDNDVYSADLKFSLVVEPSRENDDLVVKVLDSTGAVVTSARIAGENANGQDYKYADTVVENGKTYYVLKDMHLAENSSTTFNLKLEGTQYLTEGVYVFESEHLTVEDAVDHYIDHYRDKIAADDTLKNMTDDQLREHFRTTVSAFKNKKDGEIINSQNFVGYGSGTADVNVGMSINLTFNVEESTVTTERVWHEESDDDNDGGNGGGGSSDGGNGSGGGSVPTSIEEAGVPLIAMGDAEIPLSTIEDAPTPLGILPATGEKTDGNNVLMFLLAGFSMLVVMFTEKRKKKI